MIRYTIDSENKTIQLLSGGSMSELKDLCKKYKDYSLTISLYSPKLEKQGMSVGAAYVPLISRIDHN